MRALKQTLLTLLLIAAAATFFGCGGGGGGGGGFFGPAIFSIQATPTSIFVGDRTLVTAQFEQVNEDGIVVAFRYPTALSYVRASAVLEVEDDEVELTPLVNGVNDNNVYLVFVLPHSAFGEDSRGTLSLQLLGISKNDEAKIELDPSIRDLDVPDNQQFILENPIFGTDTRVTVEVRSE